MSWKISTFLRPLPNVIENLFSLFWYWYANNSPQRCTLKFTTSPLCLCLCTGWYVRMGKQTWNLSKNLHRRILRLTILHRQFHLISTVLVGKNTKNEWKWRNLLRWQKFYTAAGTDGMDKFHLWWQEHAPPPSSEKHVFAHSVSRISHGQCNQSQMRAQPLRCI